MTAGTMLMPPPTWWPCFVCASQQLCAHRELELVQWVLTASAAEIAAAWPARIPPARELQRAAGAAA